MRDSIYLKGAGDYVFVPEGYYLLKNDESVLPGDRYYHYGSASWCSATEYTGQKVSTFGSAACRSKAKFKNVVTIE